MKKKILIVEDEVLISEHLKRIVQNLGYDVLDICEDYKEAVELLENEKPDLAFLDIRMNGVDEGIEVAKHLRTKDIPFLFVTSFSDKETIKKAVNQQPLGYVLKPFSKEEIEEQLTLVEQELTGKFLILSGANKQEKIDVKDILWLRSENVYVEIHCLNKMHLCRKKLNEICEELPKSLFGRIGQSYVVNLSHVSSVSSDFVFLGDHKIPLAKKYKKTFFEQFSAL